jgi:hypothetical protein
VALPEANKFAAKPRSGSDELKAQLMTTSAWGWTEAYEFELAWNGVPFTAMAIMLGQSFAAASISGSSPSRTRIARLKGRVLYPYFAIGGYSLAEADAGFAMGLYKCMLQEPEWGMAEDGKGFTCKGKGVALFTEVSSEVYEAGATRLYETGITFDDTAFQALFTQS